MVMVNQKVKFPSLIIDLYTCSMYNDIISHNTTRYISPGSPGHLEARRPRHQEGAAAPHHVGAGQLGQAEEAARGSEEPGTDCQHGQVRAQSSKLKSTSNSHFTGTFR